MARDSNDADNEPAAGQVLLPALDADAGHLAEPKPESRASGSMVLRMEEFDVRRRAKAASR